MAPAAVDLGGQPGPGGGVDLAAYGLGRVAEHADGAAVREHRAGGGVEMTRAELNGWGANCPEVVRVASRIPHFYIFLQFFSHGHIFPWLFLLAMPACVLETLTQ